MVDIKHIKINEGMKVSELVDQMGGAGFGARKISGASKVLKKMFDDGECKVFLGIAGAMVPGGMKEVLLDLLDKIDVLVVTGATLTHDLGECLGEKHYQGDENEDDKRLNDKGFDRMYNVYMNNSVYEKLESFFEKHYGKLKECENIKDFLWKIGEILSDNSLPHQSCPQSPPQKNLINLSGSKEIVEAVHHPLNQKNLTTGSILKKCWEKKIPIFCPGISDSGIGLMMWGRNVGGKGDSKIDVFSDMKEIIDIAWTSKKTGVIYVGGGLPKNFIQQSLQFSKGADYGIQITTDRPEPGGSSGAPLKEGISWGKMKKDAEFVDVFCDATIALPLIFASIR